MPWAVLLLGLSEPEVTFAIAATEREASNRVILLTFAGVLTDRTIQAVRGGGIILCTWGALRIQAATVQTRP